MRRLTGLLVMTALFAHAPTALGQGEDATAYLALIVTPTAGLTPMARQWMLSQPHAGVGMDVQWGHLPGEGGHLDSFTAGVTIPIAAGLGDVGLSVGYFNPSCDGGDCQGNFVAGGVVEGRVFHADAAGGTFALGLGGRLGFGKPSGATIWSASASVPLSLAFGEKTGIQIVPFLTPGFGWGHVSEWGSSLSGMRLMAGGGIGVMNGAGGAGFNVGVQKVFIDGGKIVVGAGFSWTMR